MFMYVCVCVCLCDGVCICVHACLSMDMCLSMRVTVLCISILIYTKYVEQIDLLSNIIIDTPF